MQFNWWIWIGIPTLIFIARLFDVTLATMRHILVYRGQRRIVPLLAFVEVLIWLVAITQVMNNLSNIVSYLAWAGGFSAGTWLGMVIEEKIALGHLIVRVITDKRQSSIRENLSEAGFGSTMLDASGSTGPVRILFVVVLRKNLKSLLNLIKRELPGCFYTIEDVRFVDSAIMTRARPEVSYPFTAGSSETIRKSGKVVDSDVVQ